MAYTTPKTYTATTLTVADMNTYQRDNISFLRANIELDAAAELTIASGSVTFTKSYHTIDTAADASTDDLDTITVSAPGRLLFLQAAGASKTVVLKDGTGNLDLGGDVYLDDVNQVAVLLNDGASWLPVAVPNRQRDFNYNAFQYPAPGTDWSPTLSGAELAAAKSAKKMWLPLTGLKQGDQIVGYAVVGDAAEADTLTLDCNFFKVNKTDPITTTSVSGGSIAQVDADGVFSATTTFSIPEIVSASNQYTLQFTGTTGTGDAITVMGAEVKVIRLA